RQLDVRSSLPTLRTPLNHVIGYAEILEEQATEFGLHRLIPDFQKITGAARNLLSMLEHYLLKPVLEEEAAQRPVGLKIAHPAGAAPGALADWKILVVDDDPEN